MVEDKKTERRDLDMKRFRFDTTLNVTHLFTTLGVIYALLSWGGDMKTAQAVQESTVQSMKADRDRERAETLQALRDINKKLDDLALRK